MSIGAKLTELAQRSPDAVAIVDSRKACRLTYRQLEEEVARAAGWLEARGLKRGDAVLVFVPMSGDLYVALLAMFRLGVVALFLDPSAGREHIERCCHRWAPAGLLAVSKAHLLRLRSSALRRIPIKIAIGPWIPGAVRWLSGDESEPVLMRDTVALDDPALVTFTSGSTGVPKAAVRTHRFLLAQFEALAPNIALVPGEVDLATLPVFTLANLAAAVTTVIPEVNLRRPGAVDARKLFAQINEKRVTRITAAPAFFECLIVHGRGTRSALPTLTKIHTGGAPVFPRLLCALKELAPNAEVVAVFGSTEAEPIAHVSLGEIHVEDDAAMRSGRGLLAGKTVPEIKLRIVRDRWGTPRPEMSGEEMDAELMPTNEPGEIVVTGEHVLKNYLGGVGEKETKFRVNGEVWHRTGDAGLLDQEGRLWLLGRCAARINDLHGTLYPFGVECTAMTFPDVRRAAVLARSGRRLLVVETDRDEPPFLEELKRALAWAKIDRVLVCAALPVDTRHNSKIDYIALQRLYRDV